MALIERIHIIHNMIFKIGLSATVGSTRTIGQWMQGVAIELTIIDHQTN